VGYNPSVVVPQALTPNPGSATPHTIFIYIYVCICILNRECCCPSGADAQPGQRHAAHARGPGGRSQLLLFAPLGGSGARAWRAGGRQAAGGLGQEPCI